MKMKMKYFYHLSAILLAMITFVGCVQWEEFQPIDVDAAPTVTLTQSSVSDSVIVVDVSSSADGFVAAILVAGSGNAVPSDSVALLEGNVSYDDYAYGEVEANQAATFTFSAVQDATYEIMAVAANADGVCSEVAVLEVSTTDSYAPSLVDADPAFTYSASVETGDVLTLYFDEAVQLGTGTFSFEGFYTGATIDATEVEASGNAVAITVPDGFPNREYIWLHWTEGAVEDASGNKAPALTTFFDGDNGVFVGAYWRMAAADFPVVSFTPDAAVAQVDGFDIVLTFSEAVDAGDVVDGDITLTYDNGAGVVTTVDVPAADVSASGTDVTITQSVFSLGTGTVTVDVPAGILSVGIGNPNAEFTATWDLSNPV